MAEISWTILADDLCLAAALLRRDHSIIESNKAWKSMSGAAGAGKSPSIDTATGIDAASSTRLSRLIDLAFTETVPTQQSIQIDVPNLGLDRWARIILAPKNDTVMVVIVPLRTAPDPDVDPRAHHLIEDAYRYLSEGVVILDADYRVKLSTGFVSNLVGRPGFANEGLLAFDEIHPDDRDNALAQLAEVVGRPGDRRSADVRISTAEGTYRWFEAVATNLLDHPVVSGILVMLRDIEARKAAEAQLAHRANHDHLTELPNRASLSEHLDRALRAQIASSTTLAAIFFDLDNLKDINDSIGHHAGDRLLLEAANRLSRAIGRENSVYRLGGDEFVVVASGFSGDQEALQFAEKIRQAVTGRTDIDGVEAFISASVGVATAPPGAARFVESATPGLHLLRDADSAMYRAKRRGRARVELFSGELHQLASDRLRITGALERAIAEGSLRLAYQPIYTLGARAVTGVEALLRWDHPEFGHLGPATFVEVAERSGLIGRLGSWALNRAMSDASRYLVPAGLRLSVNVAPRQLSDAGFVDFVRATLAASSLPPTLLTLEVTERTLVEDDEMAARLGELRQLGIGISIDDFGTGYSALAYLRRFSADELKLDASFVADLCTAQQGVPVTRAIIEMAHGLGMTVTAEGVTDEQQVAALHALGCDRGQGYYFGIAVPVEEIGK